LIELSENISFYISTHFGSEYLNKFRNYIQSEQKSYLRFSSIKFSEEKIAERLKKYEIALEKIENIPLAFRVEKGNDVIGKTLEFILGAYYIQSLSSMIPALVLNPKENDKVLDLCAAPGSKTTQLAEMMNNKGTLIANEISIERLKSLVFNVDKMNLVNTGILHSKGELLSKMFDNYFDKILVDAPCSALGIIQKKNEVSNWWNEKKAEGLAEIQFKLLLSAIKCCKVGGEIVYSTCTLTLEENELVIEKILRKFPVELIEIELPVKSREAFINYKSEHLNDTISRARRIVPWELGSEGFFVAKLKKTGEIENQNFISSKQKGISFVSPNNSRINKYIETLTGYFGIDNSVFDSYNFLIKNNDIYFVDAGFEAGIIESFVRVGSKLGLVDKNQFIQLHTLAAQTFGSKFTKNVVELLSIEELETYLNGGTIKHLKESTGQKIVKWNNYVIGTASSSKEGLKSQFPRAYRTQEIILK
jgi:16S rRNA (cytosine1407-C5)-methyltransferase